MVPGLDPTTIILTLGYVGVFTIVLLETGFFFGFFLPGDSLLFTAGLLAGSGVLDIRLLLFIIPLAAIVGDSIGYWFGSWVGPRIFTKEDSLFFNKKHVERSKHFYEKYGPRAIVLARFIPIVRTFVPILAGVGRMQYRTFIVYNILGGILWGVSLPLLGYSLGTVFPETEKYLTPIILLIVFISFLPLLREFLQWRKKKGESSL